MNGNSYLSGESVLLTVCLLLEPSWDTGVRIHILDVDSDPRIFKVFTFYVSSPFLIFVNKVDVVEEKKVFLKLFWILCIL